MKEKIEKLTNWIRILEEMNDEISEICNTETNYRLKSYISHINDYIPETIERITSILQEN